MGLLTNLLDPKVVMGYLSLLTQCDNPARVFVLDQTLVVGAIQIVISLRVNGILA